MSTVEQDLTSFHTFACNVIASGNTELTIEELFDQWRLENPSGALYAEDVAAIRASLQDFDRGERGTVAGEHSAQLRREFGQREV